MDRPLDITFHHTDPSDAVSDEIRQHVDRLTTRFPQLIGCRVSIEGLHKRQNRASSGFDVHIVLSLKGRDLAVSRAPHHGNDRRPDIHTSLREAFRAAEHQLAAIKPQPGQVAVSPNGLALTGQVDQLIEGADHAFLLNSLGSQVYFHKDSLTRGHFEALQVGHVVHYVETVGAGGPVATKVWPA